MKRMLLTTLTAATLVAGCAAIPQGEVSPHAGPLDNRTGFISRLLEAHNGERARMGMAPLRWNATLAAHAQGWANNLARRGAFEHSPAASRPGEGENLFKGTASAYTLEEMIGGFIDERRDFKPGLFPNVARDGRWENVAHYTQLIWRDTTEVGCAIATGGGEDYLACRYSPPGNVVGQRVP